MAASLHDNTRTSTTHDGKIPQRDSSDGGRQMTVEGTHGSNRSHWGVGMAQWLIGSGWLSVRGRERREKKLRRNWK